jgi:hypothetical protein
MSKIIVRIFGGLGNQLFIYAAARRLALKNDAELVIDDVSGFVRDHQYERFYQLEHFNIPCRKATAGERLEPFCRVRRYLKRRRDWHLPFEHRHYLVQEGIDFDERLLIFKPHGVVYLEGYWQSEGYFKNIEPQIREDLRIQHPRNNANQQVVENIRATTSVAVHLRFFNEPETSIQEAPYTNNAPGIYYKSAITEMEKRISGAHYFIFSDRPSKAKECLQMAAVSMTIVHHNQGDAMAYADMWLMSQCRHFIIANSTFSWWGAWLGQDPKKIVIAPGFEKRDGIMSWGFKGLLPEDWVKM